MASRPAARARMMPPIVLACALAHAGAVVAFLPLLTLLLPLKVALLAADQRIAMLSLAIIAGAITASMANLLFGWLSDLSVQRGGGRRPWMLAGLAFTGAALMLFALADTVVLLVGTVILFQLSVNAVIAPMMAIMADEIPDTEKGLAGGTLALGAPLAAGVSALLVTLPVTDEPVRLAIVAGISIAFVAPLLGVRGKVQPARSPRHEQRLARARRDLMLAWAARLLVQVAFGILSLYTLYYLASLSPDQSSAMLSRRAALLHVLAYAMAVPTAILLGRWSDKRGRRKPFLILLVSTGALALVGMALAPSPAAAMIAYCVHAVCALAFLALHEGLILQLLPDPLWRGRDLGLMNLTNTIPSLVGAILTALLATPRDFGALLLVLAAAMVVGAISVLHIRE
ncbi:MFS transporter [Sphingomonas sp. FW199]|uniref:MFS transporter n=1 Tax=Sphingomonas sp. FW199 TaxID=3400217 RepID=UPI003CEE7280